MATVKVAAGERCTAPTRSAVNVEMRRFPYPYRAMLAVCSDLDETPNAQVYEASMRFLNTTGETSMGHGVGLEVGNTIYFDMPAGQFSYWNTDDAGREMVRRLIHSGHIDCLHSYGDLATTRAHVERAIEELTKHDCRLEVWLDHSKAPSNFGPDIMVGRGDLPDSPVYHADLTCAYGVIYVWRGRTTSVIGQDRPRSLRGLWNAAHPFRSTRTIAKECVKGVLARRGNAKYAMHSSNDLLRVDHLRDGQPVYEFLRTNPYWGGVGEAATADGFANVVTERFLRRLVDRNGAAIVYTHLGKITDPEVPFAPATREAFRRLQAFQRDGHILVTTTRRMLGYRRIRYDTQVTGTMDGNVVRIDIDIPPSLEVLDAGTCESDLAGLTVYLPDGYDKMSDASRVRVFVNKIETSGTIMNAPDRSGKRSVSLPWVPLTFPEL